MQIKKPKQAVDGEGNLIYDENNNPVYETVTVHNSKEVWETTGETPPEPVAPSTEQGFEVSFPNSNNGIEQKTVQLVSNTPVELELKSGTNLNQPLLFMNLESGPDVYGAYAANKNKKYLSGDNNTSEFTVQAPENETKTLVKKWQDNAEPKNSDNIYIGVQYVNENSETVELITAGKTTNNGVVNTMHNWNENAAFEVKYMPSTSWTYSLDTYYSYNANGSKRSFSLYEASIPDGYIRIENADGSITNVKTNPFTATMSWNDASDKYETRPEPEDFAENVKELVYKKSASGAEEKMNNPVVLCKHAYKSLKKYVSKVPYMTLDTSLYKTPDEVDGYNEDVAQWNSENTTYNGDVTTNNNNVSDLNDSYRIDAAPKTFNETAPVYHDGDDIVKYNQAVAEYNAKVEEYNQKVAAFNAPRIEYNNNVDAHNRAIESSVSITHDQQGNEIIGEYRNRDDVVIITPNQDDTWTIEMPNAMNYDQSNKTYAYYIKSSDDNGNSLMKGLITAPVAEGIDPENDKYVDTVINHGNYTNYTNAIYSGGTVTNTLTGDTEFSVYKYWGDNGTESRPDCQFNIYYYADISNKSVRNAMAASGDDYTHSIVSDTNGHSRSESMMKYVFRKKLNENETYSMNTTPVQGEENVSPDVYYTYDVPMDKMPKFDATGHMYIYYAVESTLEYYNGDSYTVLRDTSYEDSPYKSNESLPNNYALNGDVLKNVLSGSTGKTVTKTWDAESRQDRSEKASFLIDQYSYVRQGNTPNYQTEDFTDLSTFVSTGSYKKMYVLYEMAADETGAMKYKVQVNWSYDGKNYTDYALYDMSEIYYDPATEDIYVDHFSYTDKDGNSVVVSVVPEDTHYRYTLTTTKPDGTTETVTGIRTNRISAEFVERYVDDIYKRDNDGNIIDSDGNILMTADGNIVASGTPALSCRSYEIKRALTADANGKAVFAGNGGIKILKQTQKNELKYYLYKRYYDNDTGKYMYALNDGVSSGYIYRTWNQIYNIDTENDTAMTTKTEQVLNDTVNDALLAQAHAQEIQQWKTDNNYTYISDTELDNEITALENDITNLGGSTTGLDMSTLSQETTALDNMTSTGRAYNEAKAKALRKAELETKDPKTPEEESELAELTALLVPNPDTYVNAKLADFNEAKSAVQSLGINPEDPNLPNISIMKHKQLELVRKRNLKTAYTAAVAAINEKTLEQYIAQGFVLAGQTEPIALAYKNQTVEVPVKLVYDEEPYIYVLDENADEPTPRLINGEPILRAGYGEDGKVVWLDNPNTNVEVAWYNSDGSVGSTQKAKYVVNPLYNTSNKYPKTIEEISHYSVKVLDGFSQDVKTKTENIGMSKYDSDGYEYVYKVYEGDVKTKDDLTYSSVEQVVDETGSYRIITTDKGYKYESREVIENGSSIVVNKLIGDHYASSVKQFSGYFLPKTYTQSERPSKTETVNGVTHNYYSIDNVGVDSNGQWLSKDYVVEYGVYRNGKMIGTANMYFNVTDTGSHIVYKVDEQGHATDEIEYTSKTIYKRNYNVNGHPIVCKDADGNIIYKNADGTITLKASDDTTVICTIVQNENTQAVTITYPNNTTETIFKNGSGDIIYTHTDGTDETVTENGFIKYIVEKSGDNIIISSGTPIIQRIDHYPKIDWQCSITPIGETEALGTNLGGWKWEIDTSKMNFVPTASFAAEYATLKQVAGSYSQNGGMKIAFPRYNENGATYTYDMQETGMYAINGHTYDPATGTDTFTYNYVQVSGGEGSYNYDDNTGEYVYVGSNGGYKLDEFVCHHNNNGADFYEYEFGNNGATYAYSEMVAKADNLTEGKDPDEVDLSVYKEYRDENQDLYRRSVIATVEYCSDVTDGVATWVPVSSNDGSSALRGDLDIWLSERFAEYTFVRHTYNTDGECITEEGFDGDNETPFYYKGTLAPGAVYDVSRLDENGLYTRYLTDDGESPLLFDVYEKWLMGWGKKIAYPSDDEAELRAQYGESYDPHTTYYYNTHSEYLTTGEKFTTNENAAAGEDRAHYKSGDKVGNFRVVEKSIRDTDKKKTVYHEERLLRTNLLLYLQANQQTIADLVLYYGANDYLLDEKFLAKIHKWQNTEGKTFTEAFYDDVKVFLNTHDDDSIIRWIKNHLGTNANYSDLSALLKDIANRYLIYTDTLYNTYRTDLESGKYSDYVGRTLADFKSKSQLSFSDVTSLDNSAFSNLVDKYKKYVLDTFCDIHPEHHRGNSFVMTNDQNYDVNYLAELNYDVAEEIESPFTFAIFNTRVGSQKVDIKMTWTDGNNDAGVRPDAVKCMITSSQPVFGDYNDNEMAEMGMERVQLTVQDNVRTYSVYKDITTGTEYYFDGTSYYSKSSDDYVHTSTPAENLQIVWNNYRATIMMTYDKDTDPHNKAQEWTYNKRNDLPKYTFASPMNRAEYPAENSAEYGSKSDGTAISYTVSPVGYYANIGSDESPIYVAWSNSSTSYSGPSGGMVEATASAPNPEINPNHTGDVYHYAYAGAASGTANLVVNKYWMDADNSSKANPKVRPDISFDIYASYKTADDKMTIAYMGAFSPLTEVGVEDEKWWTTTASLGKYTSDGYLINYYACERVTTEGDTDYEETETFIGRPTRYYVTYDENEYYTVNYNNNEYVTISGTNHTVQNYQSVEINGTIYEADDTTVTIGGTNYQIHTEDSFRYINYPTSNDRKYYLKNSTTLRIIDIDGEDYPVYRNSSNQYVIKYDNVEYPVSYYIDMNGTRTPASVNGKSVTIDAVTVKANDNDVVRYAKKDYQLKGYVTIDGKEYSLVKPTRKYVEIGNVKYGVRDSMDDSGNKHSDIANYSDILDKFWLIKTGTNIQLDSNGNTQNIIKDTNEQQNGYIRVVPLTFNSSTGDYNQGTSVNRPTSKRQLSGNKIWKAESLPRFNSGSYDKNLLPDMTLTIYRYSYDEIKEMREHDVAIESSLADDATEEQRAVAEANMYLKPIKNNDTATAKDRKYPKLVDSEHLVKANYIKENGDETDFHLTNDYKYNIKVTFEGSTDTLDKNDLYKAVTSELISQNESGFTWAFNFDGFYFDRYDSRGKPYTYVLQEGYTTNVEVWRYLTADENNSDRKDERVFIGKIDGTQAHSDTVTIDSHVTKEEGYTYYLKLVEGTDALSENYTFAYDLEQSDDGLEITNLYNMDQSLSIKLKKLWSGLPENLDPSEYPTTTFKLVRYLQDRDGSKIERSKEDVLFTQEDFNLQEYFTLGDTKIFLENQKEVEIENYSIPYDIVADEDGLHIAYNESTLVREATTEYPNGYIMIAGVAYPLTTSDTLVVADDTYTVKNVNGQNYIKIDVKSGEIKKYVVMDDVNTYITGENTFNINGTFYNVSGNHLFYDSKTKVTEKTLTAVNGNVSINGKNYAVATAGGSSYFEMNGDKYTLTQTSTEENTYTAECVTIGGKDYYLLTDAENNQYIKTGTEVYGIVQSGSQKYVNIDVRELKTDNYISWRYRKYSLVDKDNGYYARIGSQYYEVYGEGTEKYLIIPVEDNKVNVNGISYEVTSSGVKIGKKSYDVIEVDGNHYMKVPVQSSSGYRYNFETDAQDNIISVEVAYTGLAESEIELRWNNLPYYAPNMRPYIYDIQELGVTDGFTVTTLADDDDKNYENNNNGSASDVSPSGESVDSNDVWEKKDYTTTLILNPDNKKDKTTVNVGLSNNYEGSNGSVKIQKTWEGDMDYNVSPRPDNLKVKLYRTFYDTYVTLGDTVYPVERQQYIELPDANYQTHKFYVDSAVDGDSGIVYYYVDVDTGTYRISEDVPCQLQEFTIPYGANSITIDGQSYRLGG